MLLLIAAQPIPQATVVPMGCSSRLVSMPDLTRTVTEPSHAANNPELLTDSVRYASSLFGIMISIVRSTVTCPVHDPIVCLLDSCFNTASSPPCRGPAVCPCSLQLWCCHRAGSRTVVGRVAAALVWTVHYQHGHSLAQTCSAHDDV